jgi:hypothetical protein
VNRLLIEKRPVSTREGTEEVGGMRLEESSLYGKVIIPWYDSDATMIAVIVAMVPVLLFAVVGLFVSFEISSQRVDAWVPAALATGSLFVLLSASVRLFRRRRYRRRPS